MKKDDVLKLLNIYEINNEISLGKCKYCKHLLAQYRGIISSDPETDISKTVAIDNVKCEYGLFKPNSNKCKNFEQKDITDETVEEIDNTSLNTTLKNSAEHREEWCEILLKTISKERQLKHIEYKHATSPFED